NTMAGVTPVAWAKLSASAKVNRSPVITGTSPGSIACVSSVAAAVPSAEASGVQVLPSVVYSTESVEPMGTWVGAIAMGLNASQKSLSETGLTAWSLTTIVSGRT